MEQVENSAEKKIRGRRRCTISRRGIEQLGGMVHGASSVRNGSEAENRPIPEHHRFLS